MAEFYEEACRKRQKREEEYAARMNRAKRLADIRADLVAKFTRELMDEIWENIASRFETPDIFEVAFTRFVDFDGVELEDRTLLPEVVAKLVAETGLDWDARISSGKMIINIMNIPRNLEDWHAVSVSPFKN
jgi:hypothetical protein